MSRRESQKPKNLYVANFPHDVDENELTKLFKPYGEVLACQIWIDLDTRESRGFGFVTMSNREDADRAIEHLDGAIFRRRRLKVRLARAKSH